MFTQIAEITTLTEMLDYRALHHADQHALFYEGETLTFAALKKRALEVAAWLQAKGIGKAEPVLLQIPNGFSFFEIFYGVLYNGSIAVPLFPGTAPMRNLNIALHAGSKVIILPEDVAEETLNAYTQEAPNLVIARAHECVGQGISLPKVSPQDLAFLQYTSGSTGNPKGVMLTHGSLISNVNQMIVGMEITPEDVFVSWLPVYHDMGLILMTMAPFFLGAELHLLPTSLTNVRYWLQKMHQTKATFTAAPDFAYRLCVQFIKNPSEYDLSHLRVALNAAEPVRSATITSFEEKFGIKQTLVAGYGLAEATVGVSMAKPGSSARVDERGLVSVGRAFPHIQLKIMDSAGLPLPPGEVGEICIQSIANCQGYYKNPEATKDLFLHDGFFKSGDLGYLDEEGYLYISGRKKTVILSGGRTIANQEIEELIDGMPKVRKTAALGLEKEGREGELVFVFAEIQHGLSEEEMTDMNFQIVNEMKTKLGFRPARVYFLRKKTIPQTYNGKLQHLKLKEAFLDGTLRKEERILFPDY